MAPEPAPQRSGRSPWPDRVLGIVLGILLGVGIITAFLFWGSEDTIDAPALNNGPAQSRPAGEPGQNGSAAGQTGSAPRIQDR